MPSVTAVPIPPVKRSYLVWLWLGVIAAVALAFGLARIGTYDRNESFLASNGARAGVVTTASGLQYEILEKGQGTAKPTQADVALIEYVGKDLQDVEFDRSQRPTPFPVAAGATVPGFSEAMQLMPKGSKYRFWIKPSLGYGAPPPPGVDASKLADNPLAKKTLVFDVTMVDFIPQQVLQQMQMQQQMQQGGAGGGEGLPPGVGGPPPSGQ